jgi:bifunctional ADP-heptose synthase (sugar kinase/adenylyltransferase)
MLDFLKLNLYTSIIISDYAKGIVNASIVEALGAFKGPVFVDTKNPDLSIWDNVPLCFIKINEKEWDASNKKSKHPIIITKGKWGSEIKILGDKLTSIYIPTVPLDKADVIGVGDVYLAGLAVKYLKTSDIIKSMEYANKAARQSCKHIGTTEISLDD